MRFLSFIFIFLPSIAFAQLETYECKKSQIKMVFDSNDKNYSMINNYAQSKQDMFIPMIVKGKIYFNKILLDNHELFLLGSDNSFLNVLMRVKKGSMEYLGYLEFRPNQNYLKMIPPVLSNLTNYNGKC
jgi:hypothetical protein